MVISLVNVNPIYSAIVLSSFDLLGAKLGETARLPTAVRLLKGNAIPE